MLKEISGFSIPQLLLGTATGLLMLAGASTLVAKTLVSQKQLMNSIYLDVELTKLVTLMTNRISQSGWHGKATTYYLVKSVVADDFANEFSISHHPKENNHSCLVFATDQNGNGVFDMSTPEERMGFRLRQKALEMRQSGKQCNENGWQDVTANSRLVISNLSFQATPRGQYTLVRISMSAYTKTYHHITREVAFSLVVKHEI